MCHIVFHTLCFGCRINEEGLGDKDFSSIYRYIYGSGSTDNEWKEGQQLYSSHTP